MKIRLLPLLALIIAPFGLPCAGAKEKSKGTPPPVVEQTHTLDKMEVTTNPFANWGVGIVGKLSNWSKLTGGPAKGLFVMSVALSSPADVSGVQLGDEIKSVNGVAASKLRFSELGKRYHSTERGDTIKLELFNHVTKQLRKVELAITSNRSWKPKDDGVELHCWGVRLQVSAKLPGGFLIYPVTNRIARWETVQIFKPHKPKKHQLKNEQKPVIIMRRAVVYTWAGKSLALIERENRVVEIIEAAKVPESDDVVGRLLHEGSVLTLRADGSYEIQEAAPKPAAAPLVESAEPAPAPAAPPQP